MSNLRDYESQGGKAMEVKEYMINGHNVTERDYNTWFNMSPEMRSLWEVQEGLCVGKYPMMFVGESCTEAEYAECNYRFNRQREVSKEEVIQYLTVLRNLPNTTSTASMPEPVVADSVAATLAQRGSRYGDFTDHARICQDLKEVMVDSYVNMPELTTASEVHREHKWHKLSPVQKQALEVIADKIARILSGDPNYDDNWHDIQGYAKLVEDRLPKSTK